MGRRTVTQLANQIKRVLSPTLINDLGREVGFCVRERLITPYRLVLSLLAGHTMGQVETLGDIQRQFNALFATHGGVQAVSQPVGEAHLPRFDARGTVSDSPALGGGGVAAQGRWAVGRVRTHSHPGRMLGLRSKRRSGRAVPGTIQQAEPPAAVELHVTMSLLGESVERVTLTEDTASERAHLPSPEELRGDLLLADRGYFEKKYLADVARAGGFFVVRASVSINPVVRAAYDSRGEELVELRGRRLKECALSKEEMVDLDVVWGTGAQAFQARVVARWNPEEKQYTWLVTNLSRDRYTAQAVGELYRLRWQVELMFKEWKSYANLHAFDTNNAGIAEGLIWTAIAASILKRYLGQMTQALRGVEISTRKAAMCARHGTGWTIPCSCDGEGPRSSSCAEAIGGLSCEQRGSRSSEAGPQNRTITVWTGTKVRGRLSTYLCGMGELSVCGPAA